MSKKSDYFFLNIKQVYPSVTRPSALENDIWAELLEPYDLDEILHGIKAYRKNEESNFAPNPAKFKNYLYHKSKPAKREPLPFCPEEYLMEQDIKAGRCKHFFPTYCKGFEYVINVRLKKYYDEDVFKKMSRSQRYRSAVENGLFADFDKVLDMVKEKKPDEWK